MKKNLRITIAVLLISVTSAVLIASVFCGNCSASDTSERVSYEDIASNSYSVSVLERDGYAVYAPEYDPDFALLFYVGTLMAHSNYDEILTAIASSGIAVLVSDNPFPDIMYDASEAAFDEYSDIKYFVGGHSQGGGAALRRAVENTDRVVGVILYSAMVSNDATLAGTDMPLIYFEAENDKVLTSEFKDDALSRVNDSCEYVFLDGANHMCYGKASFEPFDGKNDRPVAEIRSEIVSETIAFMQKVIDSYTE